MQQIIDISTPDDGLGDALRVGFDKVNLNTTELYNGKVDKVTGKGLSENDFTDADKTKLDGIETGAQVNVNSDFGENDPGAPGYILNRPPTLYSAVGHFHFSDLATQTIPLVVLPSVPKKLTNDILGSFTVLDYAPYGISLEFWDDTNNQFDFSNLSLGDSLLIRVDLIANTTSVNQTIDIYIKLGIGTASEYDLLIDSFNVKAITSGLHILKDVSLSIDNDDWNNAPAEIYFLSDDNATVKVNGWYVPIVRKSVNIIDIIEGSLSNDPTTYTPATLPLTGTEVAVLNDGTNWVKITWNNIKAQLKTYFDTIYQVILVSGTNIKTINGNSILGSGDLVIGGGGASETILNFQYGNAISLSTTERVASTLSVNALNYSEAVTKSGSLLTGPFYMLTENITKTGTISKLRYRYFPDSTDLSIELRVYCFKQNANSTSIYDCRLMLEETLTAGSAYTTQKFEFLTADFIDANMIDGEFLAITCKKTGAAAYTLLSQNLTIIY